MREIKFRAWDKAKKRWVANHIDPWWGASGAAQDGSLQKDIALMQYTGLKDKKGVEIWEGDIVKYQDGTQHWDGSYIKPTSVRLENGSFKPFCGCGGEYGMDETYAEVLGNIYEHPHLLEDKP